MRDLTLRPALDALAGRLDDSDLGVRVMAGNALSGFGSPGTEVLLQATQASSPTVRAESVGALGRAGGDGTSMKSAQKAVTAALADASATVRRAAALACAQLGVGQEQLLQTLASDPDGDVRAMAAGALGMLAGSKAQDALIDALGDEPVRPTALRVLSELGWQPTSDTGEAIIALAKRDWSALVTLGAPAVPLLARVLENQDPARDTVAHRASALETLGQIGGVDAARAVERALRDVGGPARSQATRELARLAAHAAPDTATVLQDLLANDPISSVRVGAATALGALRHVAARDDLRTAAETDDHMVVRLAAAEALAGLGQTGLLVELLDSPTLETRRQAAIRLGELGAAEAIDPLIGALGDSYAMVRAAAMEALRQIGWTPVGVKRAADDARYSRWMTRAEQQARSGLGSADQAKLLAADLAAEDALVRQSALEALRLRADGHLARLAVPLLEDPVLAVRRSAAETLRALDKAPKKGVEAAAYRVALADMQGALELGGDARAALLRALREHPPGERADAARTLGLLGDASCADALRGALEDPEPFVRVNACLALASIADEAAAPALGGLLDADHVTVRTAAARSLIRLGPPGISTLIAALESQEAVARESAALALGQAGADALAAVPRLEILVGSDEAISVREAAAVALGSARSEGSALRGAALADRSWRVRRAAVTALGKSGSEAVQETLIRCLGDSYQSVRDATLAALDQVGWQPQGPVAVAMIHLAREDWKGLVAVGPPALGLLAQALADADRDKIAVERRVRALESVEAIGAAGDQPQAVAIVATSLSDPAGPVRALAARAAGLMAATGTASRLLEIAETDAHEHARVAAAAALGRAATPDLAERLAELATGAESPNVRLAAARAMAGPAIGDIAQLVLALTSPHDVIRRGAATELADVGNPDAIEPLIAALGDAVAGVRANARAALELLGWTPVGVKGEGDEAGYRRWLTLEEVGGETGDTDQTQLLIAATRSEQIEVRRGALEALAERSDPRVAPAAQPLLDDPDETVRAQAALTLEAVDAEPSGGDAIQAAHLVALGEFEAAGALGDEALNPLLRALAEHDAADRTLATAALASVPDERAGAAILAAMADPATPVRGAAITAAVARMGETSLPHILPLVGDAEPSVRRVAASALVGLGKLGADAASSNLDDPREEVRQALLDAISEVDAPGPELAQAIANRAQRDEVDEVRARATSLLAAAMGQEALELLVDRLREDPSFEVRLAAVNGIAQLGPDNAAELLVPALGDDYGEVRDAVLEGLTGLGWTARDGVTKAVLALATRDWPTLVALGDEAAPLVARALRDRATDGESRRKREEAVRCLAAIGGSIARQAVLEAFSDGSSAVRAAAADAATGLKLTEAMDDLVYQLEQDPDARARTRAASAIGSLGLAEAASALARVVVQDDDPTVRSAAAVALAGPGIGKVERLISQLTDSDPTIRREAALQLGRLHSRKALDPLISTLSDAYASVRTAAHAALADLEWSPFGIRRTPDAKGFDRWVLRVELHPKAAATPQLDVMVAAIGHKDPTIRAALAEGLGAFDSPKAAKALKTLVQDKHPHVAESARLAQS